MLKNAWMDECVFILRRSILKSPASSTMLLFEPFILDNMQSRSVLKSSTECPGGRYTTPAAVIRLNHYLNSLLHSRKQCHINSDGPNATNSCYAAPTMTMFFCLLPFNLI